MLWSRNSAHRRQFANRKSPSITQEVRTTTDEVTIDTGDTAYVNGEIVDGSSFVRLAYDDLGVRDIRDNSIVHNGSAI